LLIQIHSRVDLRPVTSLDSTDPDGLDSSEPLPAESSSSEQPHRSAFRDILSLRHRPNATPQERIYYLRRLREQRRNRSGDVADASEDPNERRKSKRMSARISGVFTGRRRERSPQGVGESSRTGVAQQPASDEAPATIGMEERHS
jgi:hypothetical protein